MFIYNLKLNGNKIFKFCFIITIIFLILLASIVTFKIFYGAQKNSNISSCIPQNNIYKISNNNYTNVLKAVHENIDQYIGTKISFTGYVYKIFDLNDNQFILARDMIISNDFKTVVVGFLCESNESIKLKENNWIQIEGEIIKGDYHGEMPIIKINKITNTQKPNDEYVYPPTNDYIITPGIL